MLNHRPARSTLALLASSIVLPLGVAQAATPTTDTATTSTQSTAAQSTAATTPTTTTTAASASTPTTATTESVTSSSATSPAATTTATTTSTTSAPAATSWHGSPGKQRSGSHDLVMSVSHTAHAASDPTDTISDYKFAPATITIHVGDTITWVNNGPAPHTATASNGSFNTGTLQKGQSASHTFAQAGTFAYICTIHPFMHGTVVVLAAASSSTTSGSSGSSGSNSTPSSSGATSTTATTATASTSGGLPNTGMNLAGAVAAGVLLAGGGVALRRRLSRG